MDGSLNKKLLIIHSSPPGTYEAVLTHLDISQRARTSFLIATALCALLFVVIIVMIAFWPRIPFYMKADVCVERECMESSSQVRITLLVIRVQYLKNYFSLLCILYSVLNNI